MVLDMIMHSAAQNSHKIVEDTSVQHDLQLFFPANDETNARDINISN